MSANLELSSWPGKGLNLWLVKREMFTLIPNQPIYTLPLNTVRILEVAATQPLRLNSGGTAFTTQGGNAGNCFDPTTTAGCIQTAPNGSIGYDYGAGNSNSILYIGVTPLNFSTYSLKIEYSFDNVNWITAYTPPSQSFVPTQISWFVVEYAVNARSWRITETNGATLEIQQIYFSQPTNVGVGDRFLQALSRSEDMSISTKMNTGYPSGYYFDQIIPPTITMWPVPSAQALSAQTTILYTNYRYAQDITAMFQAAQVPQSFYDALISGIAVRLALKFAPDKFPSLKQEAQEAYQIAKGTDFENVTIRFQPDFNSYL